MSHSSNSSPVVILTGAYDDQYLSLRKDDPCVCTSAGKRLILYRAIAEATGTEPLLLSPQPHGRKGSEAQPERLTEFGTSRQHFAKASGVRKIRVPLNMIHFARHVARHAPRNATFVLDNYELVHVLAILYCRLLGKRPRVILEYEDGKHLIDRGIFLVLGNLAERLARPLVRGAILAAPALADRLPAGVPTTLVPGILQPGVRPAAAPPPGSPVVFIYSGSLDVERGAPLLLDFLESSLVPDNTEFHITGQGHFVDRFLKLMESRPGQVHFHGCVSQTELARIRSLCHFGLNLQSSENPISQVTYPSKTFDYMNAGLGVVSSRAARVDEVLGNSAVYLPAETTCGLAEAIEAACRGIRQGQDASAKPLVRFSFDGTVNRLRELFAAA